MINLLKTSGRLVGTLFAAGLMAAAQTGPAVALPGTVNYVEGQVTLNGQPLSGNHLGSTQVAPGGVLATEDGRVEMLLTPGVFLRLGDHSAVKMISPDLLDTRAELLHGEAMVEADDVAKENHLVVIVHEAVTELTRNGIYEFQADPAMVAVYDGRAQVRVGDRVRDVGKGKQVALTQNPNLKTQPFDRNHTDPLYAWSKLRAGYMAEANAASAQMVVVNNPGWWYGSGWYWNPWFDTWAFLPGSGYLMSPFGFGFYSPAYWYAYAPMYYYPGYAWRARPGFGGRPVFRSGVVGGPRMASGFRAPAVSRMGGGARMGGGGGAHR
jgi:hypothetical protein